MKRQTNKEYHIYLLQKKQLYRLKHRYFLARFFLKININRVLLKFINYFRFMNNQIPAGRLTAGNHNLQSPKKVYNPIGTQSQWSFGWQANSTEMQTSPKSIKSVNNSHNQSSILLGDAKSDWKQQPKTSQKKKNFKEVSSETKPVWNYNPKTAGQTSIVFGQEKTDFRKKDQVNKERTPTTLTLSRLRKK